MSDHYEEEDNFNRGIEFLLDITSKILDTSETIKRNWGHIINIDDSKIRESYEMIAKLNWDDFTGSSTNLIEPEIEIAEGIGGFTILIHTEGINKQDIRIKVNDNIILFKAKGKDIYYYKEIPFQTLPRIDHMEWSYHDGTVKVLIDKCY
jgi:HSP20 family molecular chaperone IbpA